MMAKTIPRETKRRRPKEGQETQNPKGPNKGRELVSFVVGSYLTRGPSNVTCMQIVRFNSSGRSRINIICQHNLPLYSRG